MSQLRSMNDEAEKAGPDARKTQPSDTFRQAYADVVMQLKQVLGCLCCIHALTSVCMLVLMWVCDVIHANRGLHLRLYTLCSTCAFRLLGFHQDGTFCLRFFCWSSEAIC